LATLSFEAAVADQLCWLLSMCERDGHADYSG
jgi:hypothetical protein